MPKVGKKKFPYTAKGEKAAKSYAKRTGKKLVRAKSTTKAKSSKTHAGSR